MKRDAAPADPVHGNAEAKLAIRILLVDPSMGGVVLKGESGTGKTTLARSAAALHPALPAEEAMVAVPLGATEDNLLGSPDIAGLLAGSGYHTREGLLARADGRMLFIDDIGLLPDTLLDLVMEASVSGGLDIEREGVSSRIRSRFSLLATWNPSSGQLRPQVLDRFGLCAVTDSFAAGNGRREALEAALRSAHDSRPGSAAERERIREAARRLEKTRIPAWLVPAAAMACSRLRVDGQRGEIAAVRASLAIAAIEGSRKVDEDHFVRAAVLAVCHRSRQGGAIAGTGREEVARLARDCSRIARDQGLSEISGSLEEMVESVIAGMRSAIRTAVSAGGTGVRAAPFDPVPYGRFPSALKNRCMKDLAKAMGKGARPGRGSGGPTARMVKSGSMRGRRVRVVPAVTAGGCDLLPTVKAALLERRSLPVVPIGPEFWRCWEKAVRPAVTAMVVVDASMSSQAYLSGLGEVLTVLFDRFFDPLSRVGLVALSGDLCEMVFPPTRNRRRVFGRIRDLVPGGHSPIEQALRTCERELLKARRLEGAKSCMVLLISDCYPEPVPPGTADIYGCSVYAGVRRAADSLGRLRLPVVVLDPVNISSEIMETLPGRRLARYVARATGGILVPVPAEKVRPGGFSFAELLGAESSRVKKLTEQIASQLESYRKQQTPGLPGAPLG